MFSITTYIKLRSNYVKSIFFGALLLFIVYSFTLVECKGNSLLNGLQNLQIKVFNSKKEPDNFDFDALTFSQLMEYLKWPNETACERVGYYGGILVKTTDQMEGQKAFCLDNGVAPALDNCLIYSFGINNEWSFDDFMSESYGCHVGN